MQVYSANSNKIAELDPKLMRSSIVYQKKKKRKQIHPVDNEGKA